MSEKKRREITFSPSLISSILFIFFSSFFLFHLKSEVYVSREEGINARTFPFIVLSLILALSLFLFIREMYLIIRKKERHFVRISFKEEAYSLLIFIILLLYAVSTSLIGFVPSSFIFPTVLSFALGERKWYRLALVSLLSVIIALVFRYALHVRF